MPRYFLEVSYKGTNYSGFQIQQNANSIQGEVEKALQVLQKRKIVLTGSSRTDAGVHALQNFFHFDFETEIYPHFVYKMNAILPADIVVQKLIPAGDDAHCRFDAISREYKYYIYQHKDPFLKEKAFYFPYKLDLELMQEAALLIKQYTDFASFSKRKTQVRTFQCNIIEASWQWQGQCLVFYVKADRFLRGMVRALVATMLKIGRSKMTVSDFKKVIAEKDWSQVSFAAPAQGLFLMQVNYPKDYFNGG